MTQLARLSLYNYLLHIYTCQRKLHARRCNCIYNILKKYGSESRLLEEGLLSKFSMYSMPDITYFLYILFHKDSSAQKQIINIITVVIIHLHWYCGCRNTTDNLEKKKFLSATQSCVHNEAWLHWNSSQIQVCSSIQSYR